MNVPVLPTPALENKTKQHKKSATKKTVMRNNILFARLGMIRAKVFI